MIITMTTKAQVIKAINKLPGASINIDKGRFNSVEIIAPDGMVWEGNYCSVYSFEHYYDYPISELWDEVLTCINYGLVVDDRIN